jgi:hypothetical protein
VLKRATGSDGVPKQTVTLSNLRLFFCSILSTNKALSSRKAMKRYGYGFLRLAHAQMTGSDVNFKQVVTS